MKNYFVVFAFDKTILKVMKFAILLILLVSDYALASERINTKTFAGIEQLVSDKKAQVGSENLLVVYDFDNTLMAMNQDIGSDQWYNWQSELLRDKKSKDAVAATRGELFDVHYKISALGKMHLVESAIPAIVKAIQQMKIKSIVLTSRGSVLRSDIESELADAELEFKSSAFGPEGGYASTFLPEGLDKAREISFMDGIVMGSGQHKGKILSSVLKKAGAKFKVIIFVDDTLKNIENMEETFKHEVDLVTFYYSHEQERVEKFQKDKSKARREWQKLKLVIQSVFTEAK